MRARLGDGDGDGDGDGTYHLLCLWLMPQLLAALRMCARGWRRVAGPSVFCMSQINESVGCVRMRADAGDGQGDGDGDGDGTATCFASV